MKINNKINKRVIAVFFTLNFLLLTANCFSQGAAINTTGTAADASAILDVSSTNAGMLIPRMSKTQRNAIGSPAEGLLIYQTDDTVGFWYRSSGMWKLMGSGAGSAIANGSAAGNTLYWDGSQWIESSNIYNAGASVGIGTNNPDASASLELGGVSKGLLINRMTTAERDLIQNPAIGLQIFNTDCENIDIYVSSGWKFLNQSDLAPISPTSSNHNSTENQIIWNWNTVSGATGYKYNTLNDYGTATDNGTSSSYTQTGLTCNTSYTLYVWSYNNCGESQALVLNESTSACFICGTSTVSFTYNTSPVTYGTVEGDYNNGQYCWLDRNLGASTVATAVAHVAGYGDYFQWGRLDDGHQVKSPLSGTTTTVSSSTTPGHNKFIQGSYNWYSGSNPDNLWQGVTGINNPCPTGWRLPTETELNNEITSWANNNYNGAINSSLHMPAAGSRSSSNGSFYDEGSYGVYWSSTVSSTNARYLNFYSSNAGMSDNVRALGFSVRCIRD